MENSSPNPSFSICDFRIQKQMSRSFVKSFPQKNSFGKTESALLPSEARQWRNDSFHIGILLEKSSDFVQETQPLLDFEHTKFRFSFYSSIFRRLYPYSNFTSSIADNPCPYYALRISNVRKNMPTPQWIKKLGGHAGELYVATELSKRGIINALLPENFSDDDILFGKKDGKKFGYIQVKSCHPDRSNTFILKEKDEKWIMANNNQFVVFVWLGSLKKNESPRYWIAKKKEVGVACKKHSAHGTSNWERRFSLDDLDKKWQSNWGLLENYLKDKNKE